MQCWLAKCHCSCTLAWTLAGKLPLAWTSGGSSWNKIGTPVIWQIFNSQQRICWVQSLGPGTWHENARPENPEQSWPGTLLEPFAVGLQSWANIYIVSCSHPYQRRFHGGNSELRIVLFSLAQRSLCPVGMCLKRLWSHMLTSPDIIVPSWHVP